MVGRANYATVLNDEDGACAIVQGRVLKFNKKLNVKSFLSRSDT